MKPAKYLSCLIALSSFAALASAWYLQHVEQMLPCPLCIIQRYGFLAVLLCAVLLFILRTLTAKRIIAGLGLISAIAGGAVAGWHLWVKAHPTISCGIDPLETTLNKISLAKLWPAFFQADGLCTTPYPPILGLSIPMWSLLMFVMCAIGFLMILRKLK